MSDDLCRLVYYSRNDLQGSPEEVAVEIRRILAVAQARNREVGVTGALMFNGGCFAQVLEGPRDAVEATFERIQRDHRHGAVTLLDVASIGERGFPSWSMAFVGTEATGRARFGGIADESGFDPARMTGEHIFEALNRLVLEDEAA
jgi:hypothetical protein